MLIGKRRVGVQKKNQIDFYLIVFKNREIRNKTINKKVKHKTIENLLFYFTNLFFIFVCLRVVGMNRCDFDVRLEVDAPFHCIVEIRIL